MVERYSSLLLISRSYAATQETNLQRKYFWLYSTWVLLGQVHYPLIILTERALQV